MSDVRPDPNAFDDEGPTTLSRRPDDPGPAVLATDRPLDFVLGGAPDRQTHADDPRGHSLLEVHLTWNGTLIDTHHARRGVITGGEATGQRWRLLGQDVAWVPAPLALVLPFAPPMLSEVDTRPRADLPLSGEGVPTDGTLPLFRESSGAWEALLQPGWAATLESADGEVTEIPASSEASVLDIPDGAQLTVQVGALSLHARRVPASKKVLAANPLERLDYFFLGLLALGGTVAACATVLILLLPGAPESDYTALLDRTQVIVQPDMRPEDPPVFDKGAEGRSAERAKGEDGTRGEEVARDEPGAGAQDAPTDQEIVKDAGLLGALQDAGLREGFGGSVSDSVLEGIGFMHGKGVARGSGGLGDRNSGLGGGGRTDGIGGLGPKCPPGATCVGTGHVGNGPGGWEKRQAVLQIDTEETVMIGGIDPAQIDKVIKANLAKFRYCYQRQLQRDPTLRGKVVNRFTIAQDGTVSSTSTKASSVGSPAVDSCIASTMSRLQFPKPRGGGIAIVSYPFTFSAN